MRDEDERQRFYFLNPFCSFIDAGLECISLRMT